MNDVDVHHAAREGDIKAIRTFLAQGGSANEIDRYDCEPLFYAVKHDQLEVAKLLFDAGGQINRNSKLRGDPIGVAVWNLNFRMVKFVVDAGGDINLMRHGETPLDLLRKLRDFPSIDLDFEKLNEKENMLISLGARTANGDI